jgi:methylglutaconyl-CoA hydratase
LAFVESFEKDHFFHVRLNRPQKRNAMNREMILDLTSAFEVAAKTACRAVYLYGEGSSFSAGADLSMMQAAVRQTAAQSRREANELFAMLMAAADCPLPILARVQGHAMGGALGLLCAADIAAAVEGCEFAFSEVRLGLVPAVISPFCLQKIPRSEAARWMLTGERMTVKEALRAGIIHFHGPASAVDEFVTSCQRSLLASGPEALRETKRLLREVGGRAPAETKAFVTKLIVERRRSPEGQAGLLGFLEKKPVPWRKEL